MPPATLTPAERHVIACAERGETAVMAGIRLIRANTLRAILLGLPLDARITTLRAQGLRVKGARIDGHLDLINCGGGGGTSLPGLALEDCDLSDGIDLSGAHLAYLSLAGSRITLVRLVSVRLDGSLNISGVRGTTPDAEAWIDARVCTISGEVLARAAHLRAPPRPDGVPARRQRYGFDLSDASVEGSVILQDARVVGGVDVKSARIRADFQAIDAYLEGVEGAALRAHSATIEGAMLLDRLETKGGGLAMTAIRTSGLQCNDATLRNRSDDGQANALAADFARIDAAIYLRGRFSSEGRISLIGARIGGTLDCSSATLRNLTANRTGVALTAANAEIGGGVLLNRGFLAEGRVNLSAARISGILDCAQASFRNKSRLGDAIALAVENTTIGGAVLLRRGFSAEGLVSLLGAAVGVSLDCDGATFRNRTISANGIALCLERATIGGGVGLSRSQLEGRLVLSGARIGAMVTAVNSSFANGHATGTANAIEAEHAELRGPLLLRGITAEGRVDLLGATIAGSLECDGARLRNRVARGTGTALLAENTDIGDGVYLRSGFVADGAVSLLGAKIGRNLDCSGALIRNDAWRAPALLAFGARIGGGVALNRGFTCIGRLSLRGCQVDGDLMCTGGSFIAAPPPDPNDLEPYADSECAIEGTNLSVAGDISLNGARVIGTLTFEHAAITGSLIWNGLSFPRGFSVSLPSTGGGLDDAHRWRWGYRGPMPDSGSGQHPDWPAPWRVPQLVLAHAHIDAELRATRLRHTVPLSIDLRGARVHTLNDVLAGGRPGSMLGWGGRSTALDLDGFVYERFADVRGGQRPSTVAPAWLPGWFGRVLASGGDVARARIAWLRLQSYDDGRFRPQPYRRLATTLRAQGYFDDARDVAVAEQDASPRLGWGALWRPLFRVGFGYGLKPANATATMLITLLIGTSLVWLAWKNPTKIFPEFRNGESALVLTPAVTGAISAEDALAGVHRPVGLERLCGKHDIVPVLYALDMMLPVIQLHQEDRCEIASRPGTEPWKLAWAFFSILGKVVTSLALLTYSGVLKPRDD